MPESRRPPTRAAVRNARFAIQTRVQVMLAVSAVAFTIAALTFTAWMATIGQYALAGGGVAFGTVLQYTVKPVYAYFFPGGSSVDQDL